MRSQRGNIFTALLGGIVLSGALGVALFQLMGGPVMSSMTLARKTAAESEVQTAARMLISDAVNRTGADCDTDNYIEPRPWRAGAGPAGGGLIPLESGAPVTDPWGKDYGYCVWDVGVVEDTDCGGPTQLRLSGTTAPAAGKAKSQTVLAVISAGPNKVFSTTCADFTDGDTAVLTPGGDDIVVSFAYNEARQATSSLWSLKEGAPDTAKIEKNLEIADNSAAPLPVVTGSLSTRGSIVSDGAVVVDGGGASCGAGMSGLLRYTENAGVGAVEYCDGKDWAAFSGASDGSPSPDSAASIDELTDAVAQASGYTYLGLGSGALAVNDVATPNGLSNTYVTPALVNGPTATTVTTAASSTSANIASIAAGNTVIVEVAAWSGAAMSAVPVVTDNKGNTYAAAAATYAGCANQGAAGIYYFRYAAAQTNVTITVTPQGANAKLSWAWAEYSGIETASPVNLSATSTTDTSNTTIDITAAGSTISGSTELAISSLVRCSTSSSAVTGVTQGSSNPNSGWSSHDFLQASGSAGGGNLAPGGGTRRLLTSQVTNPKVRWTVNNSAGNRAAAIATFKAKVASSDPLPVYATAAGYNALHALTTGANNTAAGRNALAAATTSANNAALGSSALAATNTGGDSNTAVGRNALAALTTGDYNIGVGAYAMPALTTPGYNTAIGYQAALSYVNTASSLTNNLTVIGYQALRSWAEAIFYGHVAVGYQALYALSGDNQPSTSLGYQASKSVTTGGYPTTLGYQANLYGVGVESRNITAVGSRAGRSGLLLSSSFGANALGGGTSTVPVNAFGNTPFGANALASLTVGESNAALGSGAFYSLLGTGSTASGVAVGYNAHYSAATPLYTVAFGSNALKSMGNYNESTAFGCYAGANGTTGTDNTLAGAYAGLAKRSSYNVGIGFEAMKSFTTGNSILAVGWRALLNATGDYNLAIGASAGQETTTGTDNTAAGYQALYNNQTGSNNTAAGYQAMRGGAGASGSRNTALGDSALYSLTSGNDNAAAGVDALYSNTTGSSNTGAGFEALRNNTTGSENTAAGYQALKANDTGARNTAAGYRALTANTLGNDNAALGANAMVANQTGSDNTAVGANALKSFSPAGSIRVVQSVAGAYTGAGGTSALSFSTLPAAGNTIIVIVSGDGNVPPASAALVSDNQGGTSGTYQTAAVVSNSNVFGSWIAVYYRSNISAPGGTFTTSVTYNTNDFMVTVLEVSGLANSSPVDLVYPVVTNADPSNLYTTITSTSSTTQANELVIAATSIRATTGPWAIQPQAGWTQANSFVPVGVASHRLTSHAYGYLSTTGTVSHTWTHNDNVDMWIRTNVLVTFKGSTATSSAVSTGNTAAGYAAADALTTGTGNTAAGENALGAATADSNNTAIGYNAMDDLNGSTTGNTALGRNALGALVSGSYNTAIGMNALASVVAGSYNTAVGYNADVLGLAVTGAANNGGGKIRLTVASTARFGSAASTATVRVTNVGGVPNANGGPFTATVVDGTHLDLLSQNFSGSYTSGGVVEADNATAIGYNAKAYASNTIALGDTNVTVLGAVPASWTATSDGRLKKDIQDSDLALDFVMKLRPVSYRRIGGNGRLDYGFIAQEVEAALDGRSANMIGHKGDAMNLYQLRYGDLIAPLVKAVQQQQAVEERQRRELDALRARLDKVRAALKEKAKNKGDGQ